MPTFLPDSAFDQDRMTPEERQRFDLAVTAYDAVQQANAARAEVASPPQNLALLALMKGYHRPGPKSALFHRLLSGKAPLPEAPPTAFSYPWYDVIEGTGPFSVMLSSGIQDHGPVVGSVPPTLVLNQCAWTLEDINPAAQALETFLSDPATATLDDQAWHAQAQDLLNAQPRWTVRHGNWPAFHLFMGRQVAQARRDVLNHAWRQRDLEGGRPVILRVIRRWDDEARENDARHQAALDQPEADRSVQERLLLSAHRATPPRVSSDWDWVDYEADGWQIQRVLPR